MRLMRKTINYLLGGLTLLAMSVAGMPAIAAPDIREIFVISDDDGQAVSLFIKGLDFGAAPVIEIGTFPVTWTVWRRSFQRALRAATIGCGSLAATVDLKLWGAAMETTAITETTATC